MKWQIVFDISIMVFILRGALMHSGYGGLPENVQKLFRILPGVFSLCSAYRSYPVGREKQEETAMNRKLIKRIFPLIAIILLAPWPVAYAYDNANTPGQEAVKVTVAESKAAPHGTVFSKTTGSVTPGDFFYIDATGGTNNIAVTLYITNAAEVSRSLRYLILKVGVYVEPVAGEWQKASAANGEPIPDTFITLENGTVSFTLASPASYKITIDSGSYYCPTTRAGVASPQFNLEVK